MKSLTFLIIFFGLVACNGTQESTPKAISDTAELGSSPRSRSAMMICFEVEDPDMTRAVVTLGAKDTDILEFELVTPEHTWTDPETPRGESDVSPNLVGIKDVYVTSFAGGRGNLRGIDFGVSEPDALEMEGLHGSLLLHEEFMGQEAFGSIFYRATGNIVAIEPVVCRAL